MGRHHGGVERQETAGQRASRLLAEELKRRGWDEAELKRRKESDHNKAEIAGRLRRETTVSWDWIALVALPARGHAENGARPTRVLQAWILLDRLPLVSYYPN